MCDSIITHPHPLPISMEGHIKSFCEKRAEHLTKNRQSAMGKFLSASQPKEQCASRPAYGTSPQQESYDNPIESNE